MLKIKQIKIVLISIIVIMSNNLYADIYYSLVRIYDILEYYNKYASKYNIHSNQSSLLDELEANDFHFKSIKNTDEIIIGIQKYYITEKKLSKHFKSKDDKIWFDIVEFPDTNKIEKFWDSFNRSQKYYGFLNRDAWIFHTLKSEKDNAACAIIRFGQIVINIGVKNEIGYSELCNERLAIL